MLKALSLGAKAVGLGRFYLYPLAVGGQAGVERALSILRAEIERDMKLMGCTAIDQLSRENLRLRYWTPRQILHRKSHPLNGRANRVS